MPDYIQTGYNVAMDRGIDGALADDGPHDVVARYNEEASAEIAFGRAVKQGTNDRGCKLPTAQADEIMGVVVHSNTYSKGTSTSDLGSTGVRAGGLLSILQRGRLLVMNRGAAVGPSSRLYVRAVSSDTGFETKGGLEGAADAAKMIDCTKQGKWRGTIAQGALGVLDVDFINKP